MSDVYKKLETSMSVKDLMDELSMMDQDAKVLFACDYGDHGHTQQALTISDLEELDSCDLCVSAYSRSGMAIIEDDDRRPDTDENSSSIVILR